jgi:hypothetical protein
VAADVRILQRPIVQSEGRTAVTRTERPLTNCCHLGVKIIGAVPKCKVLRLRLVKL